jgi:transposase
MSTPAPRYQRPERQQMRLDERSLDQTLTPDHIARVVWGFVAGLDLSHLDAQVKSVVGRPGQPAIDPRILLALWILATLDGVGSARELDRLCEEHAAYLWVCGGVSVNYHTLSDFRSDNGELFDQLLTQSVASLVHAGLADVTEVAQDGVRVRASAGAGSFRRRDSLKQCLQAARKRVAALRAATEGGETVAQRSARERAARERVERLEQALAAQRELSDQQAKTSRKSGRQPREPRASTTDPEARRMKMADGGTRPAYNVELATTTAGGLIVGVDVVNAGTDHGQLGPMIDQVEKRFGARPTRALVDGGFAQLDDIHELHEKRVAVYAPVKEPKAKNRQPYAPRRGDKPGVAAWRVRMGTNEAKRIYRLRASTAEWVNARLRNWGLRQFLVRGLAKVRSVSRLFALAHNAVRGYVLRTRPAAG